MKKLLASLLTLALILSTFSACSGGNDSNDSQEGSGTSSGVNSEETSVETRDINGLQLPISTAGEELDVFLPYNGSIVQDLNTIESVKMTEEATGVHINWTTVSLAELQERFNILLNSGTYPDIVFLSFFPTYPGGWEKGVEDGVIMNMEELVQEYMPNYRAALEQNDFGAKQAMSDNHEHLIFYSLQGTDDTIEGEGVVSGLGYRADILEDLGLD